MSRYPILHQEDAKHFLTSRDAGEQVFLDDIRRWAGGGEELPTAAVNTLRDELSKLRKKYPAKLRSRDPEGGRFESEACVLVHKALLSVDRRALADHDFWTYLAVELADIVEWRFGSEGKATQLRNYGIGARSENLLFRLWLRADMGRVSGTDPYDLARSGDQDLWRSHVLRQNFANARCVARSLLRLQAGKLVVESRTAKRLVGGEDPTGVRMLAKRLKRVRANVVFEYLTPKQADALVYELSRDLKQGK